MASLMSLPNELKLRIIEYLEADNELFCTEDGEVEVDEEQVVAFWKTQGNDSLRTLPTTTHHNIRSLSCVNHPFRSLTDPLIFKVVVLRNTRESARSLQALAHGPHARFVKRIEYEIAFVNRPAFFGYHEQGKEPIHYVPQ